MKVLLLAAGESKRMQPVKDKNMLFFSGKPLVIHQVEKLIKAGFKDIIVIGGAHNLRNLELIHENYDLEAKFQFVEQENLEEGMAGAVISAKNIIGDETLLIVSGNDVVDIEAYKLVKNSLNENCESLILGKKVRSYFPGGYLETKTDRTIKSIIEKPGEGNEPGDLVNIVVHLHKNPQKLIKTLETISSDKDDKYEVALDKLIKNGAKMKVLEFDGYWQPIKYPWHVFPIMEYFFENTKGHISKEANIAKTAVINNKESVTIKKGAKIFDNAVINGPCFIGENVVIANNSLVRNSIVNKGSVIGYSTEIARSYIGENVWTHSNYIGDSIVSDNCAFGAGTVTGNLRLDESEIKINIKGEKCGTKRNKFGIITGENIRCGINTSFMPGIKIGGNSIIGAGITIPRDIPENSFVKGKTEIEIKPNKATANPEKRKEMLDSL